MKKIFLAVVVLLAWQGWAYAQNTFKGMIEFEATVRIDVESIRQNNPEAAANIPDVFNYTEKLFVNGNLGKVERIFPMMMGGGRNNPQQQQRMMNQFRRFIPETYWNFSEKKVYTFSTLPKDSVNVDKYVVEKTIEFPQNIKKDEKKTKKILGYNCKKATLKTDDDTYTIWYTTELGFTYSPLSQSTQGMQRWGRGSANAPKLPVIVIENAVVMAVEGTDIGFEAKKISKDEVQEITMPTDAQKVTEEELREIFQKRRGNFSRMTMGGGR
ncbi:MAG: hypothetical protein KatS3mg028_1146 [Bacteroidia bacterium]|jgi:GLPGLI family protein|nr:MAG: hypothetical protein KatS3mg028_1146 [Bacteroidia bacterium]